MKIKVSGLRRPEKAWVYIVKEAWRSPRGLSKLLFLLRPAACNKTRVKVVGLCDSERGYGPLSERIIDQPPWDRDERFMLLYGLLNNRVEIHARALDLWSTAISKPGLTTFSSSWGAGREERGSVVEHGERDKTRVNRNFLRRFRPFRESDWEISNDRRTESTALN